MVPNMEQVKIFSAHITVHTHIKYYWALTECMWMYAKSLYWTDDEEWNLRHAVWLFTIILNDYNFLISNK